MLLGGKNGTVVKLLDFGLAKLPEEQRGAVYRLGLASHRRSSAYEGRDDYRNPTVHGPEQLEGKKADYRADIFAFGAVLYEMIANRKAFTGASQASLVADIMGGEPPLLSSIRPTSPPALDRIIRRCLAKNPEYRWQTSRDLVYELRWIADSGNSDPTAQAFYPPRSSRRAWIVAGALGAGLITILAIHLREVRPEEHTVRFLMTAPEESFFRQFDTPVLSPDGRRVVYGSGGGLGGLLHVRPLDSTEWKPIPGTEEGSLPFWSPDSRFLAFFAGGMLKKIDLKDGPAVTICDQVPGGWGGSWSRDDVIVFAPTMAASLMRVSASGGKPALATRKGCRPTG